MKLRLILIIVLLSFFLFPVLSGIAWPKNFMPAEIGEFLHKLGDYWLQLFKSAMGQ
jgi:hypothetical protein